MEKEATKIHCMAICNIDTGEVFAFGPDRISDGVDMLNEADLIVGHNVISFDLEMLSRLVQTVNTPCIDTLLVSRMMYPEDSANPLPDKSHSLKSWGKHIGFDKLDYQGGWDNYSTEMLEYCMVDAQVSAKIFLEQEPFIKFWNNPVLMEMRVAQIISSQTSNGFSFDLAAAQNLEMELLIEKSKIEDQMQRVFPDKIITRYSEKTGKKLKDKIEVFNPGSRQQIAERLIEKYGWEPPVTDKGNYKVDEETLAKLDYPEAKFLMNYLYTVKLMSQVSDWLKRAESSRDGKIHAYVNTLGTVTGRMSSNQPNIQQVSKDKRARKLFIPRKDWVLVGADLKGLELRMLAHYLAKYDNGAYAEIVVNGDVHTTNQTAMELDTRDKAKTAIYCFLYGGGDEKFGKTVGCSSYKAKKIKENLLNNIPGLRNVVNDCRFASSKYKSVKPFDWREIPVRSDHAALNTLLQSSGAHIAKAWTCFINKTLTAKYPGRWAWVANVHDEVQIECDPTIAKQVGEICLESARVAGEMFKCRCRIDADYKIGSNWAETH